MWSSKPLLSSRLPLVDRVDSLSSTGLQKNFNQDNQKALQKRDTSRLVIRGLARTCKSVKPGFESQTAAQDNSFRFYPS